MHDLISSLKPLIALLLLPPTPTWLLLLLGLWLRARRQNIGTGLCVIALLLAWLSCTEGMGQWLWTHALKAPPALQRAEWPSKAAPRTAVLVLGGGIYQRSPAYGAADLKQETLERLRYGIWLARQLDLPVGFTGGRPFKPESDDVSEAVAAARVARQEFGLPLRWTEDQARDTVENARYALPLLRKDGIRDVLLVTSAAHMPRALRAFRQEAGKDLRIIAAPIGWKEAGPTPSIHDWAPSAEGLRAVRYACYELLALGASR
ncbi:YdcF family protein [Paucibacter sp. APW11]|uniref:YdcF family protein n=1 Tax=Roseateles aquae TaxID=3077235 RepID=A0ABU3P924_9BURK|nr:YdcF family protein [Paucibacter sp. APW11]MDT8998715.1 YdcF family protein [Paucibacter sp. APW11]